jgi:hypothetical protein
MNAEQYFGALGLGPDHASLSDMSTQLGISSTKTKGIIPKIYLFVGSNTGRTTLTNIIAKIIGEEHVAFESNLNLSSFDRTTLLTKRLVVVNNCDVDSLRFLSIPLKIERTFGMIPTFIIMIDFIDQVVLDEICEYYNGRCNSSYSSYMPRISYWSGRPYDLIYGTSVVVKFAPLMEYVSHHSIPVCDKNFTDDCKTYLLKV